jgi:hypothetical protein
MAEENLSSEESPKKKIYNVCQMNKPLYLPSAKKLHFVLILVHNHKDNLINSYIIWPTSGVWRRW